MVVVLKNLNPFHGNLDHMLRSTKEEPQQEVNLNLDYLRLCFN